MKVKRTQVCASTNLGKKLTSKVVDLIYAYGHEKIRATHESTFEITKDNMITERGDCIIAVRASKGLYDLKENLKKLLRNDDSKVTIIFKANGLKEVAIGKGSRSLTLEDLKEFVVRKSDFICGRTMMIGSNKAAYEFNRSFIELIRNPKTKIKIEVIVEKSH